MLNFRDSGTTSLLFFLLCSAIWCRLNASVPCEGVSIYLENVDFLAKHRSLIGLPWRGGLIASCYWLRIVTASQAGHWLKNLRTLKALEGKEANGISESLVGTMWRCLTDWWQNSILVDGVISGGSNTKTVPYMKPTDRAIITSAFRAVVELYTRASVKHFLQKTVPNNQAF